MKHTDIDIFFRGRSGMGFYLNSAAPYFLYKSEASSPYFVDKSQLLEELFPFVEQGNKHVCITRPRRFGKTVMANMIGTFFEKGIDSHETFDLLKISGSDSYQRHINQYDVIYIDFSKMPNECNSYSMYISRIEKKLKKDLTKAFPDSEIDIEDSLWDILDQIFIDYDGQKFIFVMDEWDNIFHRDFVTENDKKSFLLFLSNLLKDHAYVAMSYMTGILPISKYSSGSELNMFMEFKMTSMEVFGEYFGFTDEEVDNLYEKYLHLCKTPQVSRERLREWYDGYFTVSGKRLYNPRSVVMALRFNQISNYWTSSGPYDEIFYYIQNDISQIKNDLALMVSGEGIKAKVDEFAASAMELKSKNQIYSAMVVYGLLTFNNGKVFIPNKELMLKYEELLQNERSLGYVYQLAQISDQMLEATLSGDTQRMANILQYAHNTESPILSYNNEIELSAIVNLVYLSARNKYQIEREDKAGKGYVDFIFYPWNVSEPCIILELKVDSSPEEAIQQIRDKDYILRFRGKLGENRNYTGKILGVGISYDRETKEHQCKIEILSN